MIATVRSVALWTRARASNTTIVGGDERRHGEKGVEVVSVGGGGGGGGNGGGGGVAGADATEVIHQLKQLTDKLDPSSSSQERIERVEVAKGKGARGRKATPKPVQKYGSGMERVRALAVSMRVWVLLAQWALPMSTRRDDKAASDGEFASP